MLITHKAVGVLQVSAATAVQVLGPLLPHCQMSLCGQPADKPLWILCKEPEGRNAIKQQGSVSSGNKMLQLSRKGSWEGGESRTVDRALFLFTLPGEEWNKRQQGPGSPLLKGKAKHTWKVAGINTTLQGTWA